MATSSTQTAINNLTKSYLEGITSEDDPNRKSSKYAQLEELAVATDMSPENLGVLSRMLAKNVARREGIMADKAPQVLEEFMDEAKKMQSKRDRGVPGLRGAPKGFGSREDAMVKGVQILLAKLKEGAVIPYDEGQE